MSLMALFACVAFVQLVQGYQFNPKKTSLLSFDATEAKNRPVSKVITLLKDMLKQMEKESEEDEEIYDKMACWCKTNEKKKTKRVAEEESRIGNLKSKIGALSADGARLNGELKAGKAELGKDEKSLDQATSMRTKEAKAFTAEEVDTLQAVQSLKAAIVVLEKGKSMLQIPKTHIQEVQRTLHDLLSRHSDVLDGALTRSSKRKIGTFIQSASHSQAQGEILGILKQMLETFQKELSSAQKEELSGQKSFANLDDSKSAQIQAGEAMIETKTQELATTDSKNVNAKQDSSDTSKMMVEDEKFLGDVKEKCSMFDREFEQRTKDRQLEMEAVSKALSFLSSDDAHDLFTKTFNPSLLQTGSTDNSRRRERAAALLNSLATKHNHPRLASIAMRVQLDAFAKVKKAIGDMIAQLLKEKEDEIKKKDFCVEEFNKNELETERKTRQKTDQVAKIEDLELTIKEVTGDLDALKSDVEELQVQLKRAGEDREKQNKEFQETVADQRATQKLLEQAGKVLKSFYNKKAKVFAQTDMTIDSQASAPPAGFKQHKQSAASGGVMGMIDEIINDAKAMEAEAIRDEEDAQKSYEDFVKDTNASITRKSKDMVHKSKLKAKTEGALVQTKEDKDNVLLELEQLANYKSELHSDCDFITKNFEIRQTARDEEVEALKQASAILSGSKFSGFLQQLVR